MNAPGAHTELPGPGLKACSKCKMAKPLVEYFKDKSKPDSLYSQVGLQCPGLTQDWPYACLCEACCTQQHRLTALIDFKGTACSTSPPLLSVTLPIWFTFAASCRGDATASAKLPRMAAYCEGGLALSVAY